MPPTLPYVYPIVKTEKREFTVRPPTPCRLCFPVRLCDLELRRLCRRGLWSVPEACVGEPVLRECSGEECRPTHEEGRCGRAYFVICLAASTIDRAPMPKWSTSSSGFPLCGIVRTASLCTLMPSGPTALSTASPRPPCA